MRWALMGLLLVAACEQVTECTASRNCIDRYGMSGLCARMRCAFIDNECASGYKWDDSAGSLAGMCVDSAEVPDAAVRDARIRADALVIVDAGTAD